MVNSPSRLDAVYSAIADPTRRAMVERLSRGGLSVSELGQPFAMTLAAVGKHVAVLEAAGIVRTTKIGRVRSCAMVPNALGDATSWLARHEQFWNSRVDALIEHLEEKS